MLPSLKRLRRMTLDAVCVGVFLCTGPFAAAEKPAPETGGIAVEGFKQLIPRGKIAAVFEPTFVAAEQAKIPEDAWILGYTAGEEAYAYDLNLLNAHEVVNHKVDGQGIAAVW